MFPISITKSVHDEQQTVGRTSSVVAPLDLSTSFFLSFFYLISYRFRVASIQRMGKKRWCLFVLYSTVNLRSSCPAFSPLASSDIEMH